MISKPPQVNKKQIRPRSDTKKIEPIGNVIKVISNPYLFFFVFPLSLFLSLSFSLSLKMDYRYADQYYHQYQKPLRSIYQSSSTGTMNPQYQQYYQQQDHDWYFPEAPPRRRRNKIDRSVNLHIDGEPMNDLEVIAAKNAAKNQRQSKIVYDDEMDDRLLSPPIATAAVTAPTPPSLLQPSPSLQPRIQPQEEKETLPQGSRDDMSLTDDDDVLSDASRPKKKKRWPFSYLFRPSTLKGSTSTPSPLPPTPVLSPDNGSSTIASEEGEEEKGYWAFKYPTLIPVTPAIWIKFDMINQKLITHHVKTGRLDGLQLTDSHMYNGNIPFLVIPSQQCCYVLLDLQTTQLSCLQITYTPF
ncbi:uncharacterized protein EV154DRAFT_302227 [Mucor mucedo]|uniref:uncharacterized protein n=1 Tax=Mucor mucedo TaxID=29922 RepID=UPI0022203820|nr:uncharacterized protein EV154DRAFT_302227 [Mucor mucedo]KAI7888758.1 hypothetical protein EV154DRAFT_302227 [Mucor mucedo]